MSVRKSSQDLEPTVPIDITVDPVSTQASIVEEQKVESNLKKSLSHIKLKHIVDPSTIVFNDIPYKPMTYYAFE